MRAIGKEQDGLLQRIRRGGQHGVMAGGVPAEDDAGAGCGFDAQALGAEGHPAIAADADRGAHAPDVRPPGTAGRGAQDGAAFFFGGVPGRLRQELPFKGALSCFARPATTIWGAPASKPVHPALWHAYGTGGTAKTKSAVWPSSVSIVISCVSVPAFRCTASITYFPGGRFGSVNAPVLSVTAKNG